MSSLLLSGEIIPRIIIEHISTEHTLNLLDLH